ncbi:MAG TPA: hypothetical protein VGK74_11585 [Symbiobacteriaceae bacterium]|jgi:hypothetical protein
MPGKFDFSRVVPRKKNMLDASGTVLWDSYRLELVVLAEALLAQVSEDAIAQKHPRFLRLEPFEEEPGAVVGVPAMQAGPDTVPINYFDSGRSICIDLSRYFAVEPLHIPRGTRAYIPISRKELPALGHCLIIHFGKVDFKEIATGKKKAEAR